MSDRDIGSGHPRKADNLEVSEVVDGFVVYQPDRERVHYLNRTALVVLELSTGANDLATIARFVQDAFDLPELPTAEIDACLTQLRQEHLIS